MAENYDVIIVGSGPAGIFTALELAKSSNLSILLLEKGTRLDNRCCPIIDNHNDCLSYSPCGMISG